MDRNININNDNRLDVDNYTNVSFNFESTDPDEQLKIAKAYHDGEKLEQSEEKYEKHLKLAADLGSIEASFLYGERKLKSFGNEEEFQEAIRYFEIAHDNNYFEGSYRLALIYMDQNYPCYDLDKAIKYLKFAADNGHVEAQCRYGEVLEQGLGVEKNNEEAAHYYKMAADKEHHQSQFLYGMMLKNGVGVEQNYPEAAKYYKMAADSGDPYAIFNYGLMLKYGYGVKQDIFEAAKCFKSAADKKLSDAQNLLGLCYKYGTGVDKNMREAAKYFKLSADQGNPNGQNNYGWMLKNGCGTEKDFKKALSFYEMAANQGNAYAINNFASLICEGSAEGRSIKEAAELFRESADQGNQYGQNNYGFLLDNGIGVERNLELAAHYYKLSANQGNTDAMYNIGMLYKNGSGVEKDNKKAAKYLRLAAEGGNTNARYAYGSMLQTGEGVTRNSDLGQHFLDLAVAEGGDNRFINKGSFRIGSQISTDDQVLKLSDNIGNLEDSLDISVIPKKKGIIEKDLPTAVRYIKLAADNGNINAAFEYANMARDGQGMPRDTEEASRYYKYAADSGHVQAPVNYAQLLLEYSSEDSDREEAYRYFKLAGERGNGSGFYQISKMLKDNESESLEYLQLAAELCNLDAMFELACLQDVKSDPENKKYIANIFKGLADKGHAKSIIRYAEMLRDGDGIEQDLPQAAQYFLEAAKSNDPEALYQVALIYNGGIGLDAEPFLAFKYMQEAADTGHAVAAYYTGLMLDSGVGCPADYQLAMKYILMSAGNGNQEAKDHIPQMRQYHKQGVPNEFAIKTLYEMGNPAATFLLGKSLANKKPRTPQDTELAMKLLKDAYDKKIHGADFEYSKLLSSQSKTDEERAEARRLLEEAVNNGNQAAMDLLKKQVAEEDKRRRMHEALEKKKRADEEKRAIQLAKQEEIRKQKEIKKTKDTIELAADESMEHKEEETRNKQILQSALCATATNLTQDLINTIISAISGKEKEETARREISRLIKKLFTNAITKSLRYLLLQEGEIEELSSDTVQGIINKIVTTAKIKGDQQTIGDTSSGLLNYLAGLSLEVINRDKVADLAGDTVFTLLSKSVNVIDEDEKSALQAKIERLINKYLDTIPKKLIEDMIEAYLRRDRDSVSEMVVEIVSSTMKMAIDFDNIPNLQADNREACQALSSYIVKITVQTILSQFEFTEELINEINGKYKTDSNEYGCGDGGDTECELAFRAATEFLPENHTTDDLDILRKVVYEATRHTFAIKRELHEKIEERSHETFSNLVSDLMHHSIMGAIGTFVFSQKNFENIARSTLDTIISVILQSFTDLESDDDTSISLPMVKKITDHIIDIIGKDDINNITGDEMRDFVRHALVNIDDSDVRHKLSQLSQNALTKLIISAIDRAKVDDKTQINFISHNLIQTMLTESLHKAALCGVKELSNLSDQAVDSAVRDTIFDTQNVGDLNPRLAKAITKVISEQKDTTNSLGLSVIQTVIFSALSILKNDMKTIREMIDEASNGTLRQIVRKALDEVCGDCENFINENILGGLIDNIQANLLNPDSKYKKLPMSIIQLAVSSSLYVTEITDKGRTREIGSDIEGAFSSIFSSISGMNLIDQDSDVFEDTTKTKIFDIITHVTGTHHRNVHELFSASVVETAFMSILSTVETINKEPDSQDVKQKVLMLFSEIVKLINGEKSGCILCSFVESLLEYVLIGLPDTCPLSETESINYLVFRVSLAQCLFVLSLIDSPHNSRASKLHLTCVNSILNEADHHLMKYNIQTPKDMSVLEKFAVIQSNLLSILALLNSGPHREFANISKFSYKTIEVVVRDIIESFKSYDKYYIPDTVILGMMNDAHKLLTSIIETSQFTKAEAFEVYNVRTYRAFKFFDNGDALGIRNLSQRVLYKVIKGLFCQYITTMQELVPAHLTVSESFIQHITNSVLNELSIGEVQRIPMNELRNILGRALLSAFADPTRKNDVEAIFSSVLGHIILKIAHELEKSEQFRSYGKITRDLLYEAFNGSVSGLFDGIDPTDSSLLNTEIAKLIDILYDNVEAIGADKAIRSNVGELILKTKNSILAKDPTKLEVIGYSLLKKVFTNSIYSVTVKNKELSKNIIQPIIHEIQNRIDESSTILDDTSINLIKELSTKTIKELGENSSDEFLEHSISKVTDDLFSAQKSGHQNKLLDHMANSLIETLVRKVVCELTELSCYRNKNVIDEDTVGQSLSVALSDILGGSSHDTKNVFLSSEMASLSSIIAERLNESDSKDLSPEHVQRIIDDILTSLRSGTLSSGFCRLGLNTLQGALAIALSEITPDCIEEEREKLVHEAILTGISRHYVLGLISKIFGMLEYLEKRNLIYRKVDELVKGIFFDSLKDVFTDIINTKNRIAKIEIVESCLKVINESMSSRSYSSVKRISPAFLIYISQMNGRKSASKGVDIFNLLEKGALADDQMVKNKLLSSIDEVLLSKFKSIQASFFRNIIEDLLMDNNCSLHQSIRDASSNVVSFVVLDLKLVPYTPKGYRDACEVFLGFLTNELLCKVVYRMATIHESIREMTNQIKLNGNKNYVRKNLDSALSIAIGNLPEDYTDTDVNKVRNVLVSTSPILDLTTYKPTKPFADTFNELIDSETDYLIKSELTTLSLSDLKALQSTEDNDLIIRLIKGVLYSYSNMDPQETVPCDVTKLILDGISGYIRSSRSQSAPQEITNSIVDEVFSSFPAPMMRYIDKLSENSMVLLVNRSIGDIIVPNDHVDDSTIYNLIDGMAQHDFSITPSESVLKLVGSWIITKLRSDSKNVSSDIRSALNLDTSHSILNLSVLKASLASALRTLCIDKEKLVSLIDGETCRREFVSNSATGIAISGILSSLNKLEMKRISKSIIRTSEYEISNNFHSYIMHFINDQETDDFITKIIRDIARRSSTNLHSLLTFQVISRVVDDIYNFISYNSLNALSFDLVKNSLFKVLNVIGIDSIPDAEQTKIASSIYFVLSRLRSKGPMESVVHISQDVIAIMEESGLTSEFFGFIVLRECLRRTVYKIKKGGLTSHEVHEVLSCNINGVLLLNSNIDVSPLSTVSHAFISDVVTTILGAIEDVDLFHVTTKELNIVLTKSFDLIKSRDVNTSLVHLSSSVLTHVIWSTLYEIYKCIENSKALSEDDIRKIMKDVIGSLSGYKIIHVNGTVIEDLLRIIISMIDSTSLDNLQSEVIIKIMENIDEGIISSNSDVGLDVILAIISSSLFILQNIEREVLIDAIRNNISMFSSFVQGLDSLPIDYSSIDTIIMASAYQIEKLSFVNLTEDLISTMCVIAFKQLKLRRVSIDSVEKHVCRVITDLRSDFLDVKNSAIVRRAVSSSRKVIERSHIKGLLRRESVINSSIDISISTAISLIVLALIQSDLVYYDMSGLIVLNAIDKAFESIDKLDFANLVDATHYQILTGAINDVHAVNQKDENYDFDINPIEILPLHLNIVLRKLLDPNISDNVKKRIFEQFFLVDPESFASALPDAFECYSDDDFVVDREGVVYQAVKVALIYLPPNGNLSGDVELLKDYFGCAVDMAMEVGDGYFTQNQISGLLNKLVDKLVVTAIYMIENINDSDLRLQVQRRTLAFVVGSVGSALQVLSVRDKTRRMLKRPRTSLKRTVDFIEKNINLPSEILYRTSTLGFSLDFPIKSRSKRSNRRDLDNSSSDDNEFDIFAEIISRVSQYYLNMIVKSHPKISSTYDKKVLSLLNPYFRHAYSLATDPVSLSIVRCLSLLAVDGAMTASIFDIYCEESPDNAVLTMNEFKDRIFGIVNLLEKEIKCKDEELESSLARGEMSSQQRQSSTSKILRTVGDSFQPISGLTPKEMALHYKNLADQGSADGQYGYGICLMNGIGVPANIELAAKYFKISADKGNHTAEFVFSVLRNSGNVIERAPDEAIEYMNRAVKGGVANAKHLLDKMLRDKESEENLNNERVEISRARDEIKKEKDLILELYERETTKIKRYSKHGDSLDERREPTELRGLSEKVSLKGVNQRDTHPHITTPSEFNTENQFIAQSHSPDSVLTRSHCTNDHKHNKSYNSKDAKGSSDVGRNGLKQRDLKGNNMYEKEDAKKREKRVHDANPTYKTPHINGNVNISRTSTNNILPSRQICPDKQANKDDESLGVLEDAQPGIKHHSEGKIVGMRDGERDIDTLVNPDSDSLFSIHGKLLPDDPSRNISKTLDVKRMYSVNAKKGDPDSQMKLALLSLSDGDTDSGVILDLLNRSAQQNNTDAKVFINALNSHPNDTAKVMSELALHFKDGADNGNHDAQYLYGLMMQHGFGMNQNIMDAAKYMQISADNGNAEAQFNLAVLLEEGAIGEPDPVSAAKYYKLAADQGHLIAQFNFSLLLQKGRGVQRDAELAAKYTKLCADLGDPEGQNNFGIMLKNGLGVKKNLEKATDYFSRSAGGGSSYGQNNYGVMLCSGAGQRRKNTEEGIRNFIRSAKQENVFGLNNLAVVYRDGIDIEKDPRKAFDLFLKSAKLGEMESMYNVGLMYYKGQGVKQNYKEALKYMKKAADSGHIKAQLQYATFLKAGKICKPDLATSLHYYKLAASRGSSKGECLYGLMVKGGHGCKKDLVKASKHLKCAADNGNSDAALYYASMVHHGEGVKKDQVAACLYYKKAADMGNVKALKAYERLYKKLNKRRLI